MILATVNTGNFEFVAVAATEDDAIRFLLQGWRDHCADYYEADRNLMRDLIRGGEINIATVEHGTVLRDLQPIRRKS